MSAAIPDWPADEHADGFRAEHPDPSPELLPAEIPDFASTSPDEYAGAVGRARLAALPEPELDEAPWPAEWGPDPHDDADYQPPTADELTRLGQAVHDGIRVTPVLERLGARILSDISTEPAAPLLADRLDAEGHTVLFGTGGSGKGSLAAWWAVLLVRDGHRVLIVDYEAHPGEWSRRIGSLGGPDLTPNVLHVSPMASTWHGVRGPLWQQAPDLLALADAWRATVIIIDSIVPACGAGDPTKPEVAGQYATAVELLGRPVLSLGHVTKADDMRFPFGSVFHHNLARVTWSLAEVRGQVILTNRKHNNGEKRGRLAVTMTWRDDRLEEVWERPYAAVLSDLIAEVMGDEHLTIAQVLERLNDEGDEDTAPIKLNSVRVALRRGIEARKFTVAGVGATGLWSVVE